MKTLHPDDTLAHAERLCRDYAALASQVGALTRCAERGDVRACDDAWDAFSRALDEHLAFAEAELFPRYLASEAGGAAFVLRGWGAHDELRREALRFGVELQLTLVNPEALRAFLEGVRERLGREASALCAWAESQPEGGLRGLLTRASEAVRRAA
ncbi:MAG TPA: hemerythrin domain-containing protein [Polyangiaceae bacterium]|nr:hemerythrin domain-containing protein [Polyangiaceae bacterium]